MTLVYLDNNATTFMSKNTNAAIIKWINKGNPSTTYGNKCKCIINAFKQIVTTKCNAFDFDIIITSCASESNSTILISIVNAYKLSTGLTPHIITSNVEHKSILQCCETLKYNGLIELTILKVFSSGPLIGLINTDELSASIQVNTCMISIMSVNNETGIITSNMDEIIKIAHSKVPMIPVHSDTVQYFGKVEKFNPIMDAFSLSFHKINGPLGIGALCIRKSFKSSYNLQSVISGTQNNGFRGGTENIPAIAGACQAMLEMKNTTENITYLAALRLRFIAKIHNHYPIFFLDEFKTRKILPPSYMVLIAPDKYQNTVTNTFNIAIVKSGICNVKIQQYFLSRYNIVVGLGSACNKNNASSYVLNALDVPELLIKKVIRVSTSYNTKFEDIDNLSSAVLSIMQTPTLTPT